MSLNSANFGTEIRQEVQGQGFWDSFTHTFPRLTSITATTTAGGVVSYPYDNSSDAALLGFMVPDNYDVLSDMLEVEVTVSASDASASTIDIDALAYVDVGSDSISPTTPSLSGVPGQAVTAAAGIVQKMVFELYGFGLKPAMSVGITVGATITGGVTLTVYGYTIRYRRNMTRTTVGTDPANR